MTMRSIDTRFWSDGWIRKLNALDRYVMLYLLTNEHSTWCGVYELDIEMLAFESGVDKVDLERAIFPRLAPKAIYFDGWVYIPNWMKYHLSTSGTLSPQHKKGFDDAWGKVPARIRRKIKEIEENRIPTEGVSPSSSSSSSAFASSFTSIPNASQSFEVVSDLEEIREPVSAPKYPHAKEVFALWGNYPKSWLSPRYARYRESAENLYQQFGLDQIREAVAFYQEHKGEQYCPVIGNPSELEEKWSKLFVFQKRHG